MQRRAEQTKNTILATAAKIVSSRGMSALTLDAVVVDSGVSKGGLLYHFKTKDALVEALVGYSFALFLARLERHYASDSSDAPGRWLRAYVHATFELVPDEVALEEALFNVAADAPSLAQVKEAEVNKLMALINFDNVAPAQAWSVIFACDGLWINEASGRIQLDPSLRGEIKQNLLALIQSG